MKILISHILIVVMLFSSMIRTIVVADYSINKEFIAKYLCVNRDKPKSHCNGKCHLRKQLEKQDRADSKTKSALTGKLYEEYCLIMNDDNWTDILTDLKTDPLQFYKGSYSEKKVSAVFHPPTINPLCI